MSECPAWLGPAPSPCFVIDCDQLERNCKILAAVRRATGARILLALKAFSAWSVFPLLARYLQGTCASSVDEARLGAECFGGETHAFAAAWSAPEMRELAGYADHIVFNSLEQWRKLGPGAAAGQTRRGAAIEFGLRINPEHSEGAVAIYNPCAPGSRLGIRRGALKALGDRLPAGLSGLHFHTLCEQGADALERTLAAVEAKFAPWLPDCQWINFGGGHHITKPGYDLDLLISLIRRWQARYGCRIYLEPGEAVALNAGWLVATVLDVVEADLPIAILDVSVSCHMPDVLEMPYRPEVWLLPDCERGERTGAAVCRLAGKSCLAGDVIGEYAFSRQPVVGDRLAFADMAIYSMVKTTTFNGLRLPSIALHDSGSEPALRVIREFDYADFKTRLS